MKLGKEGRKLQRVGADLRGLARRLSGDPPAEFVTAIAELERQVDELEALAIRAIGELNPSGKPIPPWVDYRCRKCRRVWGRLAATNDEWVLRGPGHSSSSGRAVGTSHLAACVCGRLITMTTDDLNHDADRLRRFTGSTSKDV